MDHLHAFLSQQPGIIMSLDLLHRLTERTVESAILRVFYFNDTADSLRRDDKQERILSS